MKKAMAFGMVAVLVMLPILGFAETPAETAAKAAADAATLLVKGTDALAIAQGLATKDADAVKAAAAALDQAKAKGDATLIQKAMEALQKAKLEQSRADDVLKNIQALVEKLKIIADKAKADALLAAAATNPKDAAKAAKAAQADDYRAHQLMRGIDNEMESLTAPVMFGITTTTTTTSTTTTTTTRPSPTPPGRR